MPKIASEEEEDDDAWAPKAKGVDRSIDRGDRLAWLLYQLDPEDAAPNPASNVKGPGADEVDILLSFKLSSNTFFLNN